MKNYFVTQWLAVLFILLFLLGISFTDGHALWIGISGFTGCILLILTLILFLIDKTEKK